MTLTSILLLLLVAGLVGGVAQALVGVSGRGCLVSIAVGLVGALLGNVIAKRLNFPELLPVHIGTTSFPLVWSIVGAVLFVTIVVLLTGHRRGR